jgi:type IV secretory pathway TrbL component
MKILAIYLGFYSLILIISYFLNEGLFMALTMVLSVFFIVVVVAFVMYAPLIVYHEYKNKSR